MSFLYYILSLEKRPENKFSFDKEPSILIEVLFAMKIDVKTNSVFNIWYYIAMKNELEINFILVNEPCIFAMKIYGKINSVLINEPSITVGKTNRK